MIAGWDILAAFLIILMAIVWTQRWLERQCETWGHAWVERYNEGVLMYKCWRCGEWQDTEL